MVSTCAPILRDAQKDIPTLTNCPIFLKLLYDKPSRTHKVCTSMYYFLELSDHQELLIGTSVSVSLPDCLYPDLTII